jgi:hypothetical protein
MTRDEREEERAFLAELRSRTGKDLRAWMEAITARGFADKNETIDWLRAQGFPFARASWLERIHNNGGKPIYQESVEREGPAAGGEKPAPAPARTQRDAAYAAKMEKLLQAAKGYRPLYRLLEEAVRSAVPGVVIAPRRGYISFAAPREFAAVTLHATQVRLGLALGDRPWDARTQKASGKGIPAAITHMVVLADARQIDAELTALIAAAQAHVNG